MLRPARQTDRDLVLAWRNHPEVRRASLTTHVIGADEHHRWWATVERDPARSLLIYEHLGRPAGVVTIARDGTDASAGSWGFYLDLVGLRERGELLPAWLGLEREAIGYAFDRLGLDRLAGETLASNTQVLALHRRFGFRPVRSYHRPVDGVPREVVWTQLRAGDRRDGAAPAQYAHSTRRDGKDVTG